jgi:hypothetical protein
MEIGSSSASLSGNDDYLCVTCHQIPFPHLFSLCQRDEDGLWASQSWDLQKLQALGQLDDETTIEAPCAFCRLLAYVISWSDGAREFEHRTLSLGAYMAGTPDIRKLKHGWEPRQRSVSVRGKKLSGVKMMNVRLPWDILPLSPPGITVASSFAKEEVAGEYIRVQRADTIFERPYPRHARLVDERLVDLSLARGWIERCDITHRESCQRVPLRRRGESTTFRFRLIDVDDGCIVNTELNYEYE